MPESVEVCAGSPKKDESPAPSGEVRWEVEDPSEFRPDILSDMGKDETEFRVFNVSARTHNIIIVQGLWRGRIRGAIYCMPSIAFIHCVHCTVWGITHVEARDNIFFFLISIM